MRTGKALLNRDYYSARGTKGDSVAPLISQALQMLVNEEVQNHMPPHSILLVPSESSPAGMLLTECDPCLHFPVDSGELKGACLPPIFPVRNAPAGGLRQGREEQCAKERREKASRLAGRGREAGRAQS